MLNDQPETIYFYAQTDPYAEFSNFAPFGVAMVGQWWPTVEHYFQAQKFCDPIYRERIRACAGPKSAKALGMTRNPPLRSDWEDVKDQIMFQAVKIKFQTHERPRTLLLSTGNARISESAQHDSYWASGIDGMGLDKLGKILMRVREELKAA